MLTSCHSVASPMARISPVTPSMPLAVAPFSPKGWDVTAQGNALGGVVDVELLLYTVFVQALKGRHGR